MGVYVAATPQVAATPLTVSVRPSKFEQSTVLNLSVVRRHTSPDPKLPELPPVTSIGFAHGPVLVPPAVPSAPLAPLLPLAVPATPPELVPELPPRDAPAEPVTPPVLVLPPEAPAVPVLPEIPLLPEMPLPPPKAS